MVAKEFYSHEEVGNEESTLLQDEYDDYEEEETLSLCDLPNSTISPQRGDFSNYGKDHHDDDDDDNLFEFFSEEFNTSTIHDNIIFCGKLIPFKDHQYVPHNQKNCTKPTSNSKAMKSSNGSIANLKSKRNEEEVKGSVNVKSFAGDYTSMGGKVSLVRSPTKSRWFLFMFGMSSSSRMSSKEMQLSDIRNRQSRSRREPMTMFPTPENGKEVVKSKRNGNSKGMWKILKSISLVLGCSSSKLANDVVKAAFV